LSSITEIIAGFCKDFSFDDIPIGVVEKAKIYILDAIGAQLAGSRRKETKNLVNFFEQIGGKAESTLITSKAKIPMINAAFVNGEMTHDCGLDDVYPKASLHPASVVISSTLAAAEAEGASGSSYITAVVIGYDVMIRLGESIGPKILYNRGFHPTGICGAFGSAAAVGKILDLSKEKIVRSFGIAGSLVGGLMEFLSDGSTVKRLHSGNASRSGTLAVVLADIGYTGPYTVMEGKDGFFKAYAEKPDISVLTDFGKEFKIIQTGLKMYPCTRYIEPSLNIISDLQKKERIDYKNIEKVSIEIFDAAFPIVVDPLENKRRPVNDFAAQFSLPYNVAAAIVKGKLAREEYAPDVLQDKEILSLVDKIEIVEDAQMSKQYPELWPTRIAIQFKGGRKLVQEIPTAKGDPKNPVSLEEVIEKFSSLAKPVFDKERTDEIVDTIMNLEKISDMKKVGDLLRK